jgi:uncharacterized protein YodC (DUF2158 family)
MANAFKVGDVVRLKSGGPKMTVTAVGTGGFQGIVACQWFDGPYIKVGRFKIELIEQA